MPPSVPQTGDGATSVTAGGKKYTLLCSKDGVKEPFNVFGKTDFDKKKDDFHWVDTSEPHAIRRKLILKEYPQIRDLFGPEILTLPICIALCSTQFFLAWYLQDKPWWLWWGTAYIVGATINHTLQLANHELSHDLCFGKPFQMGNRILGIFNNLPTAIPSAAVFKRYHMWHHYQQGVDGVDTDIPTTMELYLFQSVLGKIIWASTNFIWYALRPPLLKPSPPEFWDIVNFVVVGVWDYYVYTVWGKWVFLYFFASALLGLSLHPVAGHFIAEHFEFVEGWETYSYLGPINMVNFNVGYHIEHHDFTKIPWSRLPKVREIAPEWYEPYPTHTSYVSVLWKFITDPNIGMYSRVKRVNKKEKRKLQKTLLRKGAKIE